GAWEAQGFADRCKGTPCGGGGQGVHDTGVTALAALALLGNGEGPAAGPRADCVRRAIQSLLARQDPSTGLIGPRTGDRFMYGHAAATWAIAEACILDRSEALKGALARAVRFIHAARSKFGAWRYEYPSTGESDSSVTGWMLLALRAAADAGVTADALDVEAGFVWLDRMTDPRSGRCGYGARGGSPDRPPSAGARYPTDKSEAITALSLFARMVHGTIQPGDDLLLRQLALLRNNPPVWEATPQRSLVDEVYWYFGTLVTFQAGGEDWERWNLALKKALLANQRRDGDAAGSWDPVGAWGNAGGRVAMTALCAMCLEVYSRYGRTFHVR
ncbi:MAG: hypothetical protein L0323_20080, partial [Planctomycetes bacterium]|nr:hypothetical protein [Planctomycetota bacterium]